MNDGINKKKKKKKSSSVVRMHWTWRRLDVCLDAAWHFSWERKTGRENITQHINTDSQSKLFQYTARNQQRWPDYWQQKSQRTIREWNVNKGVMSFKLVWICNIAQRVSGVNLWYAQNETLNFKFLICLEGSRESWVHVRQQKQHQYFMQDVT